MISNYGYVYRTTNLINNKVYTGQKKGEYESNYLGSGKYFKSALKKYGKENFSNSIIRWCFNKQHMDECETWWIKESILRFGKENVYNIAEGGSSCALHTSPHSEEGKKNIKEAMYRPEVQNKMRKPRSEEAKQHMREYEKTEEHKKHLQEAQNRPEVKAKLQNNVNLKKPKSKETIQKRVETRKKNGWFKNPAEVGKNVSLGLKKYYDNGGIVWNRETCCNYDKQVEVLK